MQGSDNDGRRVPAVVPREQDRNNNLPATYCGCCNGRTVALLAGFGAGFYGVAVFGLIAVAHPIGFVALALGTIAAVAIGIFMHRQAVNERNQRLGACVHPQEYDKTVLGKQNPGGFKVTNPVNDANIEI